MHTRKHQVIFPNFWGRFDNSLPPSPPFSYAPHNDYRGLTQTAMKLVICILVRQAVWQFRSTDWVTFSEEFVVWKPRSISALSVVHYEYHPVLPVPTLHAAVLRTSSFHPTIGSLCTTTGQIVKLFPALPKCMHFKRDRRWCPQLRKFHHWNKDKGQSNSAFLNRKAVDLITRALRVYKDRGFLWVSILLKFRTAYKSNNYLDQLLYAVLRSKIF